MASIPDEVEEAVQRAAHEVNEAISGVLRNAYRLGFRHGGSEPEIVERVRQLRDDIAACWDDANTTVDVVVTAMDRALKGDS